MLNVNRHPQFQWVGPIVIGVLGVVFTMVSATHIWHPEEPIFGMFFAGITTILGLSLIYSSYWLQVRSNIEARHHGTIVLWTAAGTALILIVLGLMVLYQTAEGATVEDPILFVIGSSTLGGVGGFLIGTYDAQRVHAQRVVNEKEKIELLNQVLRHNVLNATNILHGQAQLLESHVEEDGEPHLETVLTWSERISELTQKVRTLIEESQRSEAGLRAMNLTAILNEEIATRRETHDDVTITLETPPNEVSVTADEMLVEVFENLLDNAIQHNDASDPEIHVSVERDDESVVTRIADNGPGLPDEVRTAITEGTSVNFQESGIGLGLFLVTRFLDRYDGDIRVLDRDPRGTIVEIELQRP